MLRNSTQRSSVKKHADASEEVIWLAYLLFSTKEISPSLAVLIEATSLS